MTPYRAFLDNARVDIRAKQRVANYRCDVAQQNADAQLRPHRSTIDAKIEGGFARVFSKMPLSRVLRAGHKRTAELAVRAAETIRLLPASVPRATSWPTGWRRWARCWVTWCATTSSRSSRSAVR